MNVQPDILPSVPDEIWASGEPSVIVLEMLKAVGEQYRYVVWINGHKIYDPWEEKDNDPKATKTQ